MSASSRRGAVSLGALLCGLAFGWLALAELDGAATASPIQEVQSVDEIVRLRTSVDLDDGAHVVWIDVIAARNGQVLVNTRDAMLGTGMTLAQREDAELRPADSREPVYFRLAADDRLLVIMPQAEWGRVHRDSGFRLDVGVDEG